VNPAASNFAPVVRLMPGEEAEHQHARPQGEIFNPRPGNALQQGYICRRETDQGFGKGSLTSNTMTAIFALFSPGRIA
jgi:hypothetical protein